MVTPLPGDLVAYGGSKHEPLASRLIEAGELIKTGDDSRVHWSHISILESHQTQIESVFPYARRSKIDMGRSFVILSFEGITYQERMNIVDFSRSKIGSLVHPSTWYNLIYILSFGTWKFGGQEVCSLLAQDSYGNAKIKIDGSTPDRISYDPRFKVIKDHSR